MYPTRIYRPILNRRISMHPIHSSENMKYVQSDIRGAIYERALAMERQGIEVLKLNTGNPATFGFPMPDSVRQALLANADKAVAYCDPRGMPEAREALRAYHASRGFQDVTIDDIYVGNGVSEVAQMVLTALLNPGDEILVPSPSYSLWTNGAILTGAKPVLYTCDEAAGWYPDIQDMEKKITSRTRALVIINPNNPTGQVYSPDLVTQAAEVARRHGLLLIADEIYDRLILDEDLPFRSVAAIAPDMPVVTLNGLSKSHVVCGFRCGWAVITGPRQLTEELSDAMTKLAALRLCGNALTQLVIPAAMADDASTRAMLSPGGRIWEQREAACQALDALDCVTYVRPQAAFYVFPKLADHIKLKDDRQFALDLLIEKHILLVPGSGFDWPGNDHFRLVLLPEPEKTHQAILDIGDFLQTYRQ